VPGKHHNKNKQQEQTTRTSNKNTKTFKKRGERVKAFLQGCADLTVFTGYSGFSNPLPRHRAKH